MVHRHRRFAPVILLGSLAFAVPSAAATYEQSPAYGGGSAESVVYRFQGGNDGADPEAGLIADKDGALYGTTVVGGGSTACGSGGGKPTGCGTVFKLSPTRAGNSRYTERVLYRFQSGKRDGAYPTGELLADKDGALYGTTLSGGLSNSTCSGGQGCGTVFKLTPGKWGYEETILYRFRGGDDGFLPKSALIADNDGALYGTTANGGGGCIFGCGTVFKLMPGERGYTESVLYRFRGGGDGAEPYAPLIAGKDGALIGTAASGGIAGCGNGCGTVFRLTPEGRGYVQSILYRFRGGTDGDIPVSRLAADEDGALYGTTLDGGSSACGVVGCGTAFKLTPRDAQGSAYSESVLHRFHAGNDGEQPYAGLIAGGGGSLYGTTIEGGGGACGFGCGIIFKLTPADPRRTETVVHRFAGGGRDGANPNSGLIAADGALFGTTQSGGSSACPYGCGTVFKLTP